MGVQWSLASNNCCWPGPHGRKSRKKARQPHVGIAEDESEAVHASFNEDSPGETLKAKAWIRILKAAGGDKVKAAEIESNYNMWKAELDANRSPAVDALLTEGSPVPRWRFLGFNANSQAVSIVHHRNGNFLDGATSDDLVTAQCIFNEELRHRFIARHKSAPDSLITLVIGGPPPREYSSAFSKVMQTYYPNFLQGVVIFPVHSFLKPVVKSMLYFLADAVNVDTASGVSDVAEVLKIQVQDLPDDIRGTGNAATVSGAIPHNSSARTLKDFHSEFANCRYDLLSAQRLLRGVKAKHVVIFDSTVQPEAQKKDAITFWSSEIGPGDWGEQHYALSSQCQRVHAFVSHCWSPPSDWRPGENERVRATTYAECKAVELGWISSRYAEREELTLWVDKACIPQANVKEKMQCVMALEQFIHFSDKIYVLLSSTYFTRLWCIYEWACMLVIHSPSNVHVCLKYFVTEENLPAYIDAVRNISVAGAQCFSEDDRPCLIGKVAEFYESTSSFERFVRFTAIALITQDLMALVISEVERETILAPWIKLAVSLGFDALADAIIAAQPIEWAHDPDPHINHDSLVSEWFDTSVKPLLKVERVNALRR